MGRYLALLFCSLISTAHAGEQLLAHAKSKNLKVVLEYQDNNLCQHPRVNFQPIDSGGKPVSLTSVVKYLPKLAPQLASKCTALNKIDWIVSHPGRKLIHTGNAKRSKQWQPQHNRPDFLKYRIESVLEGDVHYRRFQSLKLNERKALQLSSEDSISGHPKNGSFLIHITEGREDVWELPQSPGILIHYGELVENKWYLFEGTVQSTPSFSNPEGTPYNLFTKGKLTGCASSSCDQVFSPLEMTRRHIGDAGWSREKVREAKVLANSSLITPPLVKEGP